MNILWDVVYPAQVWVSAHQGLVALLAVTVCVSLLLAYFSHVGRKA